MPRKKFDKKSATTYQLLYREQNDPRLHDEGASSMVLHEVQPTTSKGRSINHNSHRGRNRSDLEAELFGDADSSEHVPALRSNEGEAAEHGVYYDDSEYDYMQHLRDLGNNGATGGQSVWIEAPATTQNRGKGKDKLELDQVLQRLDLSEGKITDTSILPSTHLRKTTYQDQQDVPDALAGFQPDMDPRLREVLEALDDDAYVDSDAKDDSFFSSIAENGEELSLAEFEQLDEDDEDAWESDDTAKPDKEYQKSSSAAYSTTETEAAVAARLAMETAEDHGDGEFMAQFRNMPKASRKAIKVHAPGSLLTASSALTSGSRLKKRKGALTSSDNYSMTSSSLARTDALTTLDERFEKTLETYLEDEEDEGFADDSSLASGRMSNISAVSGLSKASMSSRLSSASHASSLADNQKFNDVMDEFLGEYSHTGKRRVVRGKPQTGMQQLDEIRRDLGPARRPAAAKVGPP